MRVSFHALARSCSTRERGEEKRDSLVAGSISTTDEPLLFFLSFSLSLEAWNRTKSIAARFKGLRRKKIELLVDWKRFYYPCVFFYNTFCIIGIFSRKKEIYLIVFKYISLYYSKKIEFLNSAKNLTLYRGIFGGSMEKDIFKKYFHRLKGLPFFFFFNFDSIHIWILCIFMKSYYFLF